MKFEDFIRNGQVKKVSKDIFLIKSLYKNTLNDLKYLNTQKIDVLSARKILSNYYDCLRSILEAIASLFGYKIYQHEAFAYFLKENGEELNSLKFDRFRKIRNKINYYGEEISVKESEEIVNEIKELINELIEKYLKKEF
ncbi:MAG: hypothetical protein KKA64_01515 [Nanoarchaeota archaeon]|nr:hypothetical protein [Nanoarchaeota archaeon]